MLFFFLPTALHSLFCQALVLFLNLCNHSELWQYCKKAKTIKFPIIIDQIYLFRIEDVLHNYYVPNANHFANG